MPDASDKLVLFASLGILLVACVWFLMDWVLDRAFPWLKSYRERNRFEHDEFSGAGRGRAYWDYVDGNASRKVDP